MFENSLVESCIQSIPATKRWTALVSMTLQTVLALAVIALPLLYPEALPFTSVAPMLQMSLPPEPPRPEVHVERTASAASGFAVASAPRSPALLPSALRGLTLTADNHPPALAPAGSGMGPQYGLLDIVGSNGTGHGPAVSIAAIRPVTHPVSVSSGVSQGMLIVPIRPVYPAIARAAHVEGTVVVEATISEAGAIESLYVVSGPEMLRSAALEAIREARYRPYRLNGQPTAVQTTITVNFRFGS